MAKLAPETKNLWSPRWTWTQAELTANKTMIWQMIAHLRVHLFRVPEAGYSREEGHRVARVPNRRVSSSLSAGRTGPEMLFFNTSDESRSRTVCWELVSFCSLSGRAPRPFHPMLEVPQSPCSICRHRAAAYTVPTAQKKRTASAFGVCIITTKEQSLLYSLSPAETGRTVQT